MVIPNHGMIAPHYEFRLNVVCSTYNEPFFIHVFLGSLPNKIDYNKPVSGYKNWVADHYVIPHKSTSGPRAYMRPRHEGDEGSAAPYVDVEVRMSQSNDAEEADPVLAPRSEFPFRESRAVPLPSSFLKNAVHSSINLTPYLRKKKLELSPPSDNAAAAITSYLKENLHWTLGKVSIPRGELFPTHVPIRMWVIREESTPPPGGWGAPTVKNRVIVWEATIHKAGSLMPGELPDLEKVDDTVA
ncbi:MAG: hypothetical protein M1829_001268 [Trizodia sp. TS-e1964]|nr:MAG: hypothetical protein M1829_001268 [Trizodia sp. TS-e1964]